jgi:hypothetical protein
MLTSVLDRLTTLLSKYFLIGYFVPVMVFGFFSGAIFYHNFTWFREWAKPEISGTVKAFDAGAVLVALAIGAYLLSTINVFLREVLEGKHVIERLPPLEQRLRSRQEARLKSLQTEYAQARNEHGAILESKLSWQQELAESAAAGKKDAAGANAYDGQSGATVEQLNMLRELIAKAEPPSVARLRQAIDAMKADLAKNDFSVADPATGRRVIWEDRGALILFFDYAEDAWAARELRAFTVMQSSFGIGYVAPTAMGNVAQSMQAYALTRYQMNLDTFWGRMQPSIQVNKDFYSQLQDAKVQLDFLVSCAWLCAATSLLGTFAVLISGSSAFIFAGAAIGGPLASYFFYFLATKNYCVFAELVRTSVDLFRFQLLQALRITLPKGIRDERATWAALQKLSTFGAEWIELSYQHEPKSGS